MEWRQSLHLVSGFFLRRRVSILEKKAAKCGAMLRQPAHACVLTTPGSPLRAGRSLFSRWHARFTWAFWFCRQCWCVHACLCARLCSALLCRVAMNTSSNVVRCASFARCCCSNAPKRFGGALHCTRWRTPDRAFSSLASGLPHDRTCLAKKCAGRSAVWPHGGEQQILNFFFSSLQLFESTARQLSRASLRRHMHNDPR